ncbi:hypothetical protein [Streptacidiphilus sp. MAP12-20]|uniref:hypothetical protein n=1 Tax=Streptacidiphilus sp. MAP12-20 TaxID=3156299 RepID=UPI003516C5A0
MQIRPTAFTARSSHPTPGRYAVRTAKSRALWAAVVPCAGLLTIVATERWWSRGWPGAVCLLLFGLVLVTAIYPVLRWAQMTRQVHSPRGEMTLALVLAAVCVVFGAWSGIASHGRLGWMQLAGFGLLAVIAFGLRDLVRGAGWRQVLLAAIPLALSMIPVVTAQIARLGYEQYLGHFGMSVDDVSSSGLSHLAPAVGPIAIGTLGCSIVLAYAGIARRFHVDLGYLVIVPMILVFAALTVVASLQSGSQAGAAAVARARYDTPVAWGSLTPEYVCAGPLSQSFPYQGDLLTTRIPLLTFDMQGSEVALWNPVTRALTRVPTGDLALRAVAGPNQPCTGSTPGAARG